MTDGTTGFHVAPITEDDMNRVTSILKRAADAIVGMSQLSADVEMLRQTVSGLQADCDRLRNQNNALDEALAHSRNVRDTQAIDLSNAKSDLSQANTDLASAKSQVESLTIAVEGFKDKLHIAEQGRDDAELKVMALEDELAAAKAKLDKIAEAHALVFGAPEPKPEPTPERVSMTADTPYETAKPEPVPA